MEPGRGVPQLFDREIGPGNDHGIETKYKTLECIGDRYAQYVCGSTASGVRFLKRVNRSTCFYIHSFGFKNQSSVSVNELLNQHRHYFNVFSFADNSLIGID